MLMINEKGEYIVCEEIKESIVDVITENSEANEQDKLSELLAKGLSQVNTFEEVRDVAQNVLNK